MRGFRDATVSERARRSPDGSDRLPQPAGSHVLFLEPTSRDGVPNEKVVADAEIVVVSVVDGPSRPTLLGPKAARRAVRHALADLALRCAQSKADVQGTADLLIGVTTIAVSPVSLDSERGREAVVGSARDLHRSHRQWRDEVRLTGSDLSEVQAVASAVYGELEPERALAWMIEELGEFAQVMRRNESDARRSEELGQVAAWVFCLANIAGVPLATALEASMGDEIVRQYLKYGERRPYRG